jgi:hypothetical protein
MKLITKNDLDLVDGVLVEAETGEVVAFNKLADEFNELIEIDNFNKFLIEKKDEIIATKGKVDIVTYHAVEKKEPTLVSDKRSKLETPVLDAELKTAEARAEEFLNIQSCQDINHTLHRYVQLAAWFETDYVTFKPTEARPLRFNGDILSLTKEDVVAMVEKMHDPEIMNLKSLVHIDFS